MNYDMSSKVVTTNVLFPNIIIKGAFKQNQINPLACYIASTSICSGLANLPNSISNLCEETRSLAKAIHSYFNVYYL